MVKIKSDRQYSLSFLDLLLIIIGPVILTFPLDFIFNNFFSGILSRDYLIMLSTISKSILLILFLYLIAIRKNKLSWKDLGLKSGNFFLFAGRGVVAGTVIVLSIIFINGLVMSFVSSFTGLKPEAQTVTRVVLEMNWDFPLFIMVVVIVFLAPFFEELYFRGLVFPFMRERWGDKRAIIGSSILFGIAHGNPWAMFPAFLGGLGLVYCLKRYKNLWVSIFAHSTWNGFMVFILLALKSLGIN